MDLLGSLLSHFPLSAQSERLSLANSPLLLNRFNQSFVVHQTLTTFCLASLSERKDGKITFLHLQLATVGRPRLS